MSSSEINLPEESLHDLLSLVCEEPSQPTSLPPYLLIAACRLAFRDTLATTRFEIALDALRHFDQLEDIRMEFVRYAHTRANLARHITKTHREVSKMFKFVWVALRRWVFINELMETPFTSSNCIALINTLYSLDEIRVGFEADVGRERAACLKLFQIVLKHVKDGGQVDNCKSFVTFSAGIPWPKAYVAFSRYLDLSQQMIAQIESAIDPIPEAQKKIGICRQDPVLHRISRHLLATGETVFDPTIEGSTRSTSPEL